MDRDIKRAKGADELPIATEKERILDYSKIDQLEEELRARDAIIERLTRENEELQQKMKALSRPLKKGAQTRYWRKEEHERFLEALEKYGQRDVKNISAYVGTRSPTQVRTHAQKYFLKQRREETAQMKSANTLARKRRLTMTTAAMEEDEEDEEDEEAEEDEEDDMELEKLGKASSLGNSGSGDLDRSGEDDFPGRRKSTRATNAAAVIKLRTQDFVAHTQASASPSGRVGSVKRSASAYSAAATLNQARGGTPQPSAPRLPTALAATNQPAANYGMSAASMYGSMAGGAAAALHGAAGTFPHFRTDIFSSAEEATQFYKAVKTYERETDRSKVLALIKEFFLPRRTIEEISNMVDAAFPSVPSVDPTGYNAMAAAAAAAFHPMYTAQGRAPMYYGDTASAAAAAAAAGFGPTSGAASHLTGASATGLSALSSGLHSAAGSASNPHPGMPLVKLDPMNPYATPAMLGYPTAAGFGSEQDMDFVSAPTHIDSSSLTSISDHMMGEHAGTKNMHNNMHMSDEMGHRNSVPQLPSSASISSDHTANSSSSTSSTNPSATPLPQPQQQNGKNVAVSSTPVATVTPAETTKKKENDDEEDSSLMSELTSLTERSTTAQGRNMGGLSSFVGGRPLTLSPGVFGSSGTTPLGFGMTPLMANSTPLGFISPLSLNFGTAQSPINPYNFGSQK